MRSLVLGDSLAALIDYRGKTPKKLGADFTRSGVPVASAQLVSDGVLHLEEARTVDLDTYRKWMSTPVAKGDVLLTSEAPLGRVARVASDAPLVLGQRLFGLRGLPGVLDSGYLYYALQTEAVQSELRGRATGSTVTGIRQSALRRVAVPAPEYHEQLAIAEVLGALDDKIAANARVAACADRLACAQFVQALRTAEWSGSTFGDLAYVSGGGTPSTKAAEYWDGDINWATPTDVTGLRAPYLEGTARRITPSGLEACASALHPAGSILMTSRATIGAFAIAQGPTAVNQGFIVVNAKRLQLQWWLFHEMRSRVDEFLSHANGATFLELSRGNFKRLPVRLADASVMEGFGAVAEPLHGRARAAALENTRLEEMRDTLLPQLMSGKIRVKDAERAVSEVV